jgi:hypothetical protein
VVNLIEERASPSGADYKLVFGSPGHEPIPFNERFLENADQVHVLVTIAALFMQPLGALVREDAQAVVALALYAAGAEVALDEWQYTMLAKRVKNYLATRHADRQYFSHSNFPQACQEDLRSAGNWAMVNHVLAKAKARFELLYLERLRVPSE